MHVPAQRLASMVLGTVALGGLPGAATADVVTGKVGPADATVVIVDAGGATVAQLKAGPYQLQLPVGKYKAKCQAPRQGEQDFLSLSEPVTVNIDCK